MKISNFIFTIFVSIAPLLLWSQERDTIEMLSLHDFEHHAGTDFILPLGASDAALLDSLQIGLLKIDIDKYSWNFDRTKGIDCFGEVKICKVVAPSGLKAYCLACYVDDKIFELAACINGNLSGIQAPNKQ
ncbi:MAG TPA: hypothetical protein VFX48_08710 [Saprospiraceae bacterium]|nr:hypothetical protein [Saprospiraceae bacterium]